jgi:periplasmic protein TonB
MSNVSIFEKKWIDLVFENKNQEYGAYQLRQENPKTTITAFIYANLFIICFAGLLISLSSFGSVERTIEPVLSTPVTLSDFPNPAIVEPLVIPATQPKTQIKEDITKKDLTQNVVVVKTADNPDDIKNNDEPKSNPNPIDNGILGGIPSDNPSTGKGSDVAVTTPVIPNNNVVTTVSLDEMPEYPGGISKFYEYVGNNFDKPELESGTILVVYVSFVIEKDGKMTDIKVLRTAGLIMDKEAIRVLKSLKTNWKPGIKDGQKVRTLYTLPIKVKSE